MIHTIRILKANGFNSKVVNPVICFLSPPPSFKFYLLSQCPSVPAPMTHMLHANTNMLLCHFQTGTPHFNLPWSAASLEMKSNYFSKRGIYAVTVHLKILCTLSSTEKSYSWNIVGVFCCRNSFRRQLPRNKPESLALNPWKMPTISTAGILLPKPAITGFPDSSN